MNEHCSERPSPRPPGTTHRIIHSIYVEFEPLPDEPVSKTTALCVPLDRDGMPLGSRGHGNGRPRAPKRRTIDLRVGDQMLCVGQWRTIRSIRAYRDGWLTAEQAARPGDGYVYRAT